jgi:hypothetical protein
MITIAVGIIGLQRPNCIAQPVVEWEVLGKATE